MKTICLWHLTLDPRVMADRNPYNKINPITSTRQYIKRIKEYIYIYVYIWNIAFFSGLCGYESSRRWRRIPNSANAFINGLLIISSQNCLGSIHTRNIIIFLQFYRSRNNVNTDLVLFLFLSKHFLNLVSFYQRARYTSHTTCILVKTFWNWEWNI